MDGGFDPDSYWRQTPRRLEIVFSACARRQMREHDGRAWLAWHIAALPYVKPFPPLADLLSSAAVQDTAQTPDEQLAIAMAWTAAVQTSPQA